MLETSEVRVMCVFLQNLAETSVEYHSGKPPDWSGNISVGIILETYIVTPKYFLLIALSVQPSVSLVSYLHSLIAATSLDNCLTTAL